MRYSLEPHYRRYVQGQGFMSFARNIGNRYGKKIFDASKSMKNSLNPFFLKTHIYLNHHSKRLIFLHLTYLLYID